MTERHAKRNLIGVLALSKTGSGRLRCARCRDVIGVYEPYVMVDEETISVSSLAADPIGAERHPTLYHLACYEELEQPQGLQ